MRPSPVPLSLAAALLFSFVARLPGDEPPVATEVDVATPAVSETTSSAATEAPEVGATAAAMNEEAPPDVAPSNESAAASSEPEATAPVDGSTSPVADQAGSTTTAGEPLPAAEAETAEAAAPSPPATVPVGQPPSALPTTPTPAPTAEVPAPAPSLPPELIARLTVLENALVAQRNDQAQVYRETSRLIMFFGTACVGMGIIAMGAAVFLMYRALNSMSTISAQSLHPGATPALQSAAGGALMSPDSGRSGFDRVQASGQRFQNRMTSLELRLEELENLAGHPHGAPAPEITVDEADGSSGTAPATEVMPPPAPRRVVPVAAILVRKAEALANLNKLTEALTTLDEARSIESANAEVHLARGRVLEKLGRLGDALDSYDQAVSTDESNTNALLMKAGVLNRQERFEEALSCYERALAVHRNAN